MRDAFCFIDERREQVLARGQLFAAKIGAV